MKHVAALGLSLVLALVGLSCERTREAIPPRPRPPTVLVDVALPTLDGGLGGLRQWVEAVKPGAGIFVSERQFLVMAGVGQLDGVAGDKPAHVLVVDPKKNQRPLAVLVGVTDAGKLRTSATSAGLEVRTSGSLAVIGTKPVVDAVGDWALGTLAKEKPPAIPVATAYSAPLLATYRDDIEKAFATMKTEMAKLPQPGMGEIFDLYLRASIALLEGTDRFEVRVEGDAKDLSVGLGAVPTPGGKLAAFVAAQSPADFALLDRLPAGPGAFVLAGTVHLGELRGDAIALFETMLTSFYKVPMSDNLRALMNIWADAATGSMGAVFDMGPGGLRGVQLIGAKEPAKIDAAIAGAFAEWAGKPLEATAMGVTTRYTVTPNAAVVDGVTFHRFTSQIDASAMPPEQAKLTAAMGTSFVAHVGAWDDVVGMAMGTDPAASRRLIDASRGKGARMTLPPRVAAGLADARARKESFYYFIDVGSMMASMAATTGLPSFGSLAMTMTLGFAGGRAEMRISMQSADFKAMIDAAMAIGAKQGG